MCVCVYTYENKTNVQLCLFTVNILLIIDVFHIWNKRSIIIVNIKWQKPFVFAAGNVSTSYFCYGLHLNVQYSLTLFTSWSLGNWWKLFVFAFEIFQWLPADSGNSFISDFCIKMVSRLNICLFRLFFFSLRFVYS